jgi:ferredoxin-NADP reductase
MLKTLTAVLVAAGIAIAPIASQAAQPATKTVTTTTKVVKLKGHKRHVARHHTRIKAVKQVRGHKRIVVIKMTRDGKIVKAHKRHHAAVRSMKVRAN